MKFVRFPSRGLNSGLTHAERSILLNLCQLHFIHCGSDFSKEFYFTDRDLASISKCSTFTIYFAKKKFSDAGILTFSRGEKNITCYKFKPSFWR